MQQHVIRWILLWTLTLGVTPLAWAQDFVEPIKVGAEDWPWWRGPSTNGVAAPGQKPPTTWNATKNVLWKTLVPGRGHGSPVIVGDHVYLPTADRKRGAQSVFCYDRNSGNLLWRADVHRGGIMSGNKRASQASTTVACDGTRIFVNFVNGGAVYTTALSRKGKQLWQTKITDYRIHQGYASSPFLYKSLVLVSADNKKAGAVAALHRGTGKIVWKMKRPKKPNYASPVVVKAAGREQLILTGCDLVSSFDPMTGKKLWEVKGATTECVTTTVTNGELIYTSGGYPKNHVSAVKADGSGKTVWSNSTRIYVPSMVIHEGFLYAINGSGVAACWAADTGRQAWMHRLGNGGFKASPVLVGNRFYAINEQGTAFVFAANPKKFEILSSSRLGDEAFATPAICGGRIYLRVAHDTDNGRQEMLYCIGR